MLETFIEELVKLYECDNFPTFAIIQGGRGSGKSYILETLAASVLNGHKVFVGNSVDEVRQMIQNAYKVAGETTYFIDNADALSMQAKSALLKVTEEPPKKARIVIAVEDTNNLLDTIISRGTVFRVPKYKSTEILSYCIDDLKATTSDADIVARLVSTPGDAKLLLDSNPKEFYDFVSQVYDCIDTVSGSNSFKIADRINFKDDAEKYDLELFWSAYMTVCLEHMWDEMNTITQEILVTSKCKQKLRVKGINKSAVFDEWILGIRKVRL